MVGFSLTRKPGETWRECVDRYARAQGLENECLEWYDDELRSGATEARAAWNALYEWDCLDLEDRDA